MKTLEKRMAPAWRYGNRAGYFGVTPREDACLANFSNQAETLGVKTAGIIKGPFGVGCLLKMAGNNANYEVLVNNGRMLLGRVEANGKRVRLCEAGTNTEAQWNALFQALKNSEGRL